MGKNKSKKNNVVYSTNPDFEYESDEIEEEETLAPEQQLLYVSIDRKQRGGKSVTLITNFIGTEDDLKDLGKKIKSYCGTGGSVKDGEIIIQGENRDKIMQFLEKLNYKTKRKGG